MRASVIFVFKKVLISCGLYGMYIYILLLSWLSHRRSAFSE
uniref:NAP1-related protein 2-like n=1 Tax=Rhizophora mucronata TaxID=61149 RepID=A0A2P2K3H2_RHIMU